MALGGGTFITQNKVLPGAYINFVSAARASAVLSDRGIVTMPLELDWGVESEIFQVTQEEFLTDSLKIFGYEYSDGALKGLRDLFLHARTLYAYRLTSGGTKASCTYARAKYGGTRGNSLKIIIAVNADDEDMFDVTTVMGTTKVDMQTVASASELKANDFVDFITTATLAATAGTALTGGTNGTVTSAAYQSYLSLIESYSFNVMGIATTDTAIKALAKAFTARMRDSVGAKFQTVLYDASAPDHMGVINVKTTVSDSGASEAALVYWVSGAAAACAINSSLSNTAYDGEYTLTVTGAAYTQSALETAINSGWFVFHNVNGEIRVLADINSLVTVTDTCGDIFKDNQTVRIVDQIANDIATLFNTRYLGRVPNDKAGRTALWSDIVKHHRELETIRAIEEFSEKDVTVERGEAPSSVVVNDAVTIVNTMAKLYMTVTVS